MKRKKTHFVPKVVYRTAFAGVVPLCVAGVACGGGGRSGADAGAVMTVACSGFCAVAAIGFTDASEGAADGPADAAAEAGEGEASDCFCCTNFCGVGIAAFGDSGGTG